MLKEVTSIAFLKTSLELYNFCLLFNLTIKPIVVYFSWHHNTQHNDTQHNDTKHEVLLC